MIYDVSAADSPKRYDISSAIAYDVIQAVNTSPSIATAISSDKIATDSFDSAIRAIPDASARSTRRGSADTPAAVRMETGSVTDAMAAGSWQVKIARTASVRRQEAGPIARQAASYAATLEAAARAVSCIPRNAAAD